VLGLEVLVDIESIYACVQILTHVEALHRFQDVFLLSIGFANVVESERVHAGRTLAHFK